MIGIVLWWWLIAFSTAFAQTEIEGEVSGEWNAEGSPYLVIGDITIPEEDTLTILQGVEISVLSELSIIVNGVLIIAGTEEERVVIHGDEENESPWIGIFFDKPDDTSILSYTDITDSEICITLDATHNLELDHCQLNGSEATVFAERDLGDYRIINASNCEFNSTDELRNIDVYAGELNANDCTFQSEQSAISIGGVLRLQDCSVVGVVVCRFGVLELEDCNLSLPDIEGTGQCAGRLPTRGFIRNCTLGGSLSVSSHDAQSFRVTDSIIEGDVNFNDCRATLSNNTIGVDSLVLVDIDEGRVVMENNIINGEVDLDDTRFTITGNSFHKIEIRGEEGNNTISGNTITEEMEIREGGQLTIENNNISGEILLTRADNSVFKKNIIFANIYIRDWSTVSFIRNTIITPEPANDNNEEMIEIQGHDVNINLNSNIFVGIYANSLIYITNQENQELNINYNCFWMMNNYNRTGENNFLRDRVNETNIITNPLLFHIDPLDIALQPISPCRNAGDPELEDDPDGTRADIGTAYFDHRIDHVPGIHSPELVYAQRGEQFRYAAKGSDEEEVNFAFIGLPGWLRPVEERDIIEDSLILGGQVPDDENDFTFLILVSDNNHQADSLSVSVRCIDQKPIGGFVSGRLSVEDSPYFIASSLVIDHDETLTIEPGCEFIVRALDTPRNKKLSIIVLGALRMSGTEEDSIKFSPELSDEVDTSWDGIMLFNPDALHQYEYLEFTNRRAFYTPAVDRVSISHSLFKNTNDSTSYTMIQIINAETISIHDNVFINSGNYITHSGRVSIHDNQFLEGGSSIYTYVCNNVVFERNLIAGEIPSLFYSSNNDSVLISRCVFDGSSPQITSRHKATIINCTFYSSSIKADSYVSDVTIINSTFTGNGDYAISHVRRGEGRLNVLYSNFFGYDSIFCAEGELGEGCISEDPLFVDPENGNYWLSDGSPLIDIGHPNLYLDPDTSRADLGAYFWTPDGSTGILESINVLDNVVFELYPNPFNSWLTVNYSLVISENIDLEIFDLNGRLVFNKQLVHGSPGINTFAFNVGAFPSGQYLLSLKSPSFHRIHNILHLK